MSQQEWRLRVSGPAGRKIADVLPEAVATAVVEFMTGVLLDDPARVGRPLQRDLAGLYAARRGTYRVIYRIDARQRLVEVIDVAHRGEVYRGGR